MRAHGATDTLGRSESTAPTADRSSPAASIRGVEKTFKKGPRSVVAVTDVDLDIERGQFVALVGPSGCGKSTLLRMLSGLTKPTAGVVEVGGSMLSGPRRDIGLMLQQPTLLPWRTAYENMMLPIEVHKRPQASERNKAAELIRLVGLERFAHHYPRELSGGMQQRVALGRLLMTSPALMLLDEPFGALDEFTREALNVELAETVADKQVTALLVTHNIMEAIFLSDKVVAMGGAPGVIRGEVEVEFERPRSMLITRTPAFQEKVAQVRHFLGLE